MFYKYVQNFTSDDADSHYDCLKSGADARTSERLVQGYRHAGDGVGSAAWVSAIGRLRIAKRTDARTAWCRAPCCGRIGTKTDGRGGRNVNLPIEVPDDHLASAKLSLRT